jgi:hypothetical protein
MGHMTKRPYCYPKICDCGTAKDQRSQRCRECQRKLDKTIRREEDPKIYLRIVNDKEVLCRRIALTKNQFAWVNVHRYSELMEHNWLAWWNSKTQSYYAKRAQKSKGKVASIMMHGAVMPAPQGKEVDHISTDTLDNTEENLRAATRGENMQNSSKRKNNKVGYKWVCLHVATGKYLAQLNHKGIHYYLGLHDDPTTAHEAAKKKAIELHGEFARFD